MKYCINCDHKIEGRDEFCESCGHKVNTSSMTPDSVPLIIFKKDKVGHSVEKPFHKRLWLLTLLAVVLAVGLIAIARVYKSPDNSLVGTSTALPSQTPLLSPSISNGKYRDPNESELQTYIPAGYKIIENGYPSNSITNNTPILIHAFLTSKEDKDVILILVPQNDSEYSEEITSSSKMAVLHFDRNTGTWGLAFDLYELNSSGVSNKFLVTDIDGNGINELHLRLTLFCGSECTNQEVVYTIKNGKIINIMPADTSNMGFEYVNSNKHYLKIGYIWSSGEPHFGCHYFQVTEYAFTGSIYSVISTKTTRSKYALDSGDAMGQCQLYDRSVLYQEFGY